MTCNAYGPMKLTTNSSVMNDSGSPRTAREDLHIYLDDIIIWSDSVKQHTEHVRMVLAAL